MSSDVYDALTPCFVPLATLLVVYLTDTSGGGYAMRIGARLTRVFAGVAGAVAICDIAFWCLLLRILPGVGGPARSPAPAQLLNLGDVLSIVWGVALVVCAWRLVAYARVSRRAIWTIVAVEVAGAVLESTLDMAWWALNKNERSMDRDFFTMVLVSFGSFLVPAALILWYWWPVLRGRASPTLDPDVPHCARCGYNLTGNVSGVCPECGTPVALVLPAQT